MRAMIVDLGSIRCLSDASERLQESIGKYRSVLTGIGMITVNTVDDQIYYLSRYSIY